MEIVDDPAATPRQKIAARLTKIEKSILQGCLDAVTTCAPCLGEPTYAEAGSCHLENVTVTVAVAVTVAVVGPVVVTV